MTFKEICDDDHQTIWKMVLFPPRIIKEMNSDIISSTELTSNEAVKKFAQMHQIRLSSESAKSMLQILTSVLH